MPEVARGDMVDTVDSPDGTGDCCREPTVQQTNICSEKVFIEGKGVVRLGDAMVTHNYPGPPCCEPHAPVLSKGSQKVFVEGKSIGRKGDPYGSDHIISSGSSKVSAG